MAKIWANRLCAGTQTWDAVPNDRKAAVREELQKRVNSGKITAQRYTEITGEEFPG